MVTKIASIFIHFCLFQLLTSNEILDMIFNIVNFYRKWSDTVDLGSYTSWLPSWRGYKRESFFTKHTYTW